MTRRLKVVYTKKYLSTQEEIKGKGIYLDGLSGAWEDVKEYLSKNDGIVYADEELMKKKTVSEIQIQGN